MLARWPSCLGRSNWAPWPPARSSARWTKQLHCSYEIFADFRILILRVFKTFNSWLILRYLSANFVNTLVFGKLYLLIYNAIRHCYFNTISSSFLRDIKWTELAMNVSVSQRPNENRGKNVLSKYGAITR